ncbi:MAG: zf-HC2 domain-containing protein [FCB group bacterium]|nr:zf-HC2 domain-containing protein [FCB group bacterium]
MTDLHTTHLHDDYLDGLLDNQQKAAVDNHIAGCDQCLSDMERLKNLTGLLQGIQTPDPGNEYFRNLADRIDSRTVAAEQRFAAEPVGTDRRHTYNDIMKTLIRLAAVITLLFTSFYVSYIKQEKNDTRWAEKISESDLVNSKTMVLPGMLIEPESDISQTGEKSADQDSQTVEIETRK